MMDDSINRQAAIDRFQALSHDDWNQGVSTSWANAYSECAEIIRDLPAAPPKIREWIPCKERLPEESGMYIVSGKGEVWICEFTRINIAGVKIGGWENDVCNPVVTAWMPLPTLPEPYKEEADE